MSDRIKVADYQRRPIEEIEFPGGEVWTLRQPLESDYFRRQEVIDAHRARVQAKAKALAAKASAIAEESKDDQEARAVIEQEADEETLPIQLTLRYMWASVLAIFIVPEQTPETILEQLPPDLIHYLLARVDEVFVGDAAKKRVRGESR